MKNLNSPKKWKIYFGYLLFIGAIFLYFPSCDKTPVESPIDRQIRINDTIQQKLERRRQIKMRECKNNALIIAEKRVDSMLLAQAKLITIDTIDKPKIPIKPDAPEILVPKDSTPIKPLFEETPDTLGKGKREDGNKDL